MSLRWLIQQENVIAISKAANKQHQEENFNIFDFTLSEDEMEMIANLAKGKRYIDPNNASWN